MVAAAENTDINMQDHYQQIVLHCTVGTCYQDFYMDENVQTLLRAGSDASMPEDKGYIPVHLAARADSLSDSLIQLLIIQALKT